MSTPTLDVDELLTRATAFALVARSLGRDPSPLRDPDHVAALGATVASMGNPALAALVERADPAGLPAIDVLAGRWVRWFDLGRVAPYEGSNVVLSAGGVTPRLADVAGYYRGVRARALRPRRRRAAVRRPRPAPRGGRPPAR